MLLTCHVLTFHSLLSPSFVFCSPPFYETDPAQISSDILTKCNGNFLCDLPKALDSGDSLCFLKSPLASLVLLSLGDLVPSHCAHADDSPIQTILLSCMPHTQLSTGQMIPQRHNQSTFPKRNPSHSPPSPPPTQCLVSLGLCGCRVLCLESVPLPLDPLTPSSDCYSTFRSQVRRRSFWEACLEPSCLS